MQQLAKANKSQMGKNIYNFENFQNTRHFEKNHKKLQSGKKAIAQTEISIRLKLISYQQY